MLRYDLQTPDRGQATHACLFLHGLGDTRRGWASVAAYLAIPGLAWVFAEAPDPYYDGFSWFPIPGMTSADHTHADLERGVIRSRQAIRELIEQLQARHHLSCDRLILGGFSQGCLMTLDVGLRHDQAFAGMMALSGFVAFRNQYPQALGAAARQQQIYWSHGTQDDLVDIAPTRAAQEWFAGYGLSIAWHEYPAGHGLDEVQQIADLKDFLTACMAGTP